MSEQNETDRDAIVDEIRDELGNELMRGVREHSHRRRRWSIKRKLAVPLVAGALVAATGGLAAADLVPGPQTWFADEVLRPEAARPAPPLLFGRGSEYPDCPEEVRQSLLELDALSDYADMPGYPIAGCPTLEVIEQNDPYVTEWQRMRLERE